MVSHLVLPHVTKMVIDEESKYILTNFEKAKRGGKSCNTDHATEYMDVNLKLKTEKPTRIEVWNEPMILHLVLIIIFPYLSKLNNGSRCLGLIVEKLLRHFP